MDTPGHVSEGDGQEEDENKWGAGAGEGRKEKKKGWQVNYTNAGKKTERERGDA